MFILRLMLTAAFLGAFIFTVVAPLLPPRPTSTLVVGIFPRQHASITQQMFAPFAMHLSRELGRRIRIKTARSFPEFWEGVTKRSYDIVHYNQYHYISSKKNFNYDVLAMNEEDGRSTMTGTIVVRKDSGIETVEDLKGRKVLFGGGPKAMQSYIYARYLLEQVGLKKDDYFTDFTPDPPNAIISTYYGLQNASAAGAGDGILSMVSKQINVDEMKVLLKGEQFAHLPWAVRSDMDSGLKSRIQKVLVDMKKSDKGRKILAHAKLTGFVVAEDKDFDQHRKIVKAVLGESF